MHSPRSLSPEKTMVESGALSPISNNSQSPNSSQRRKKAAPARRIPDDQIIKLEKWFKLTNILHLPFSKPTFFRWHCYMIEYTTVTIYFILHIIV